MRKRGDYFKVNTDPKNTKTLGKQLKIIINLQFPEVKVSRNAYAKSNPYNLPIETQKFNNKIPFPRYLLGVI